VNPRRLALPAAIAPVVFVVIVALVTAHEWDFLHDLGWHVWGKTNVPWPSATALGSWGWLQVLNFLQLGLSVILLAVAMGAALPPGRAARIGRGAAAVVGGSIVALAFKTDPDSNHITTWHGAVHAGAFLVLVVFSLVGMFAIWRSGWPRLSRPSLVLALVAFAAIAVSFAWAAGSTVIGSVSLLAILVWVELVALRLGRAA
jgi:hypothetical protein